ncbi:DBH-like monooxygenase protein 2-like [Durusdinium trenchii]|uniref:DBH-like monooxygenase protein 2-like n=1 Tax=Durusdinium trenchii TaxID=1381693 RepID=A0ABP0KJI3_9DINO
MRGETTVNVRVRSPGPGPEAVEEVQCDRREAITALISPHQNSLPHQKGVFAKHVEDCDQLVGKLRREKLYDFNHQSLEPASVSKIKRGDQLVLSCTYDTSTRTGPTTFGDFTQTEMCWSAFMYYPAQSMNRAVYYGGISMMCQGGGGVKTIQGNTVPAESCSTVGDFTSDAGKELLQSLGINATAFLNNYQYVSTSEGTYLSSSASIMSSVIPFVLQAVILFAERA